MILTSELEKEVIHDHEGQQRGYVPMLYPENYRSPKGGEEDGSLLGASLPEEEWGSPEMNYRLPPATRRTKLWPLGWIVDDVLPDLILIHLPKFSWLTFAEATCMGSEVLETPSLKLQPVFALSCRAVVDFGAAFVVSLIMTCDLADDEEYHWIIPPQSLNQIAMLATVAFWCLWTNWIITAISDFTIMYTTELWVFTGGLTRRGGHAPCCSLLRGYFTCLRPSAELASGIAWMMRYHFGTVVLGSLIVGVAQPFRIAIGLLAGMVRLDGNSVGIFSCFCSWIVDAYMVYLEPWCRNAYMDVALNGLNFYESALHTAWEYMTVVNILNGATWLFQLAGLGAITSLGHLQTWDFDVSRPGTRCSEVIIKYYPGFEDPFSPDYVQNPFLLSLCGSAVAFIMAFPFMMIFDTVSDTILFAYIVQKMREEKHQERTIYTRACGMVQTLDEFIGLGCWDQRKKESQGATMGSMLDWALTAVFVLCLGLTDFEWVSSSRQHGRAAQANCVHSKPDVIGWCDRFKWGHFQSRTAPQ
eukprot:Skav221920  [mRNA]  locus=scaffold5163:72528:89997:- [translate_table: standard]